MTSTIGSRKLPLLAAALFAALLTLSLGAPAANAQDVAAAVRAKLDKSQYKDVQVSVDANGIATLTGTVGLYEYKSDADKTVHKVKGVTAVRNDIAVAGASVPDSQLEKSLGEKLAYDRVGYGNVFDAITLQVQNGVVTLGGHCPQLPQPRLRTGPGGNHPGRQRRHRRDQRRSRFRPWTTASAWRWRVPSTASRRSTAMPSIPRCPFASPCRTAMWSSMAWWILKPTRTLRSSAPTESPGVFSVKNYLQVANQPGEKQKKAPDSAVLTVARDS